MSSRAVRGRSIYAWLFFATVFTSVLMSFAEGRANPAMHSFSHIHRAAYVPAPDPISAVEAGLEPASTLAHPKPPSAAIRAIVVGPINIKLVQGGQTVKTIGLPETDLLSVMSAVGDARWIGYNPSSGEALPQAAVIVAPGASLRIGAPIKSVLLPSRPGIFLGVDGGELLFEGVIVGGAIGDSAYAPFVVAEHRARMQANHTQFRALGRDWNGSYGVSWMDGTTGGAAGSKFEYGFIGAYTQGAEGLRFVHCQFQSNTLYGLDPHSGSKGLLVDEVLAEGNGAHGIIFSQGVVTSTIRNSVSRNNGENGIMMDWGSSGNVITNNTVVGNRGDGIVMSDSPNNVLHKNTIEGNRVGLHVVNSGNMIMVGNTISNNVLAVQGVTLPPSNPARGNGGQWLLGRLRWIWGIAGAAHIMLLLIIVALRRRRGSARLTYA